MPYASIDLKHLQPISQTSDVLKHPFSLDQIALWGDATYSGPNKTIASLARDLSSANLDQVCFLGDEFARPVGGNLLKTTAGACFIREKDAHLLPKHTCALLTPRPYRAFIQVLRVLDAQHAQKPVISISPHAHIHASAKIDPTCSIGPGAIIGQNTIVGAHSSIGAGSIIESGVVIGDHTKIDAHVTIEHAIIGHHVHIQCGARIGHIGFGFVVDDLGFLEIPHQGKAIIGDYVHIGANTTISRGSFQNTTIGQHTRIDALVQIAHNVTIGNHVVMASQCGIAGSCVIGDQCFLGGQVGLANGVILAPGTKVAAKSGVMRSTEQAEMLAGIPAVSAQQWHRSQLILKKMSHK